MSNADIVELQSRIDNYTAMVQQPRNLIVTRKSATSELELLTRDTMRLLSRRVDMLMRGFKYSNATFRRKYTDARIIIHDFCHLV